MRRTDPLQLAVSLQTRASRLADRSGERLARLRNERGEGVISAAIAVLIMAVLGAAMFAAYKVLFDDTNRKIAEQVTKISG